MLKNENKKPLQQNPDENSDESTAQSDINSDNSAENAQQLPVDETTAGSPASDPCAGKKTEQQPRLDADTKDLIIKDLQEKNKDLNERYLRVFSEFDNFRKRSIRERSELIKTASSEMTVAVLPVLDDLERAYKSAIENPDVAALTEGINLILTKLRTTLRVKGLEEIKTTGEVFDTDYHEAITHIPAPKEDDKGKVIEEVQKGYILNGKVIRFAKVIVAQ
jgi:molecular chaperone GrpE